MKVLGLDLSLKATGVCILEGGPGSPPVIRTELVPQPQVKGVEARIKRLVAIAERIVGLVELEKPDHIIIEAPAKNQQWQAASMGELHGVIKVQIYLATGQIPMVKEANEMRKFVIGKISKKAEEYEDHLFVVARMPLRPLPWLLPLRRREGPLRRNPEPRQEGQHQEEVVLRDDHGKERKADQGDGQGHHRDAPERSRPRVPDTG